MSLRVVSALMSIGLLAGLAAGVALVTPCLVLMLECYWRRRHMAVYHAQQRGTGASYSMQQMKALLRRSTNWQVQREECTVSTVVASAASDRGSDRGTMAGVEPAPAAETGLSRECKGTFTGHI